MLLNVPYADIFLILSTAGREMLQSLTTTMNFFFPFEFCQFCFTYFEALSGAFRIFASRVNRPFSQHVTHTFPARGPHIAHVRHQHGTPVLLRGLCAYFQPGRTLGVKVSRNYAQFNLSSLTISAF